jgi:hypothetical protein
MRQTALMPVTLPAVLETSDNTPAVAVLRKYYSRPLGEKGSYTGSAFDTWHSSGSGPDDEPDRFTADDVIAVTFLSVQVPPRAAYQLLVTSAETFAALLEEVGPDRDLMSVGDALTSDWPAWRLETELRRLPGVGRTIASKLLARKRPKLVPIFDSVVADVLSLRQGHWEPLRQLLRADDGELHRRLLMLRDSAELPSRVSALRVLDVLAWMEGKMRAKSPKDAEAQDGDGW